MKGAKLVLQLACKPSRQALVQTSTRSLHTVVPSTSHRILPSEAQLPDALLRLLYRHHALTSGVHPGTQAKVLSGKHSLLLSETQHSGAPKTPRDNRGGISDHEYQTRVGKACRVLVDSLPDFMQKGVVDLEDLDPDYESSSSSAAGRSRWSAKGLLPVLSPFLGQSLLRRSPWAQKGKDKAVEDPNVFDSLYHPSIAFEFRPPLPHISLGKSEGSDASETSSHKARLSPDEHNDGKSSSTSLERYDEHARGGPTICFNGRTMYVASSHLLRHALSALFQDTSLYLESARFEGRSKAGSSWPGISPYIKRSTQPGTDSDNSHGGSWQDKLVVRLRFEGISRVSSHPHTYTVIFKYEFDRATGMIARHVVDNIQPVPGSKVWAGLSNAWGTLSPYGVAGGGAAPGGGSAACTSKVADRGD